MPRPDLTHEEINDLVTAVGLWSNYIQTGNVVLSAADLAARHPDKRPKVLDEGQMRKVIALADLKAKLFKAGDFGTD